MKVQKFNESISSEIEEYIENFEGSVDYSILDWIESVSKKFTKLKEYSYIDYDNENSIKKLPAIIKDKRFKNYNKFLTVFNEIKQLEKKLEILDAQKNKLIKEVNSEVMYNFQSDLLEKDIDGFYKLFLEDTIESSVENDYEYEIFDDIHPSIYANKKYKNIIDNLPQVKEWTINSNSRKFNL